ncbi:MAG: PQQ-dependent sugar dehydrogenase [Kiloniellaceae bacterium]
MIRMSRIAGVLAALLLPCVAAGAEPRDWQVVRVASGLKRPVYVTAPPGDTERLFILEQHSGKIKILRQGTIDRRPFLDIDGLARGNEQGLLGLAFHPDYAKNGAFYVNFTRRNRDTVIRRYRVSAADPDVADPTSAMTVMTYEQPYRNHNGGWLGFGPDGYLYIAAGDGGAGGDPGNRAQDVTDQRLGKMLRIDVGGDDYPEDPARNYAIPPDNPFVGKQGDDEIWAYGLRNPWRASFDRKTGDLWIADVGQSRREEVNFQPAASRGGENYGWKVMEGDLCFAEVPGAPACFDPAFTAPVHVYGRGGGYSITGGYVYRGPVESLQGLYIFADFGSAQIWGFRYAGRRLAGFGNLTEAFAPQTGSIEDISSFGEDAEGNLYILDLGGEVFKVVPAGR